MARTQAANYDEKREAIVEQAANLYAQHGFLGASLADLAAACNMSKSLLYYYYSTKEDILFDIMASHLEGLEKAVADALDPSGAPADRLRDLSHAFMRHYVGAAARHKVFLNELSQLPEPRRKQIVARQRRIVATVEDVLKHIQPRLAGRKSLSKPAAMLFLGMVNWTHTWFDPKGPASADLIADIAVDIMTGGLPKVGA